MRESVCEDNGDSFQKYKDCDMIRLALCAGKKDGIEAGDNVLGDNAKMKLDIQ